MCKPPLRVGRISYTNVAPIETAFECGAVERPATVVSGAPTVLNALLSAGDLDASPVSAAHFIRNRAYLERMGDTAIVARREVLSVLLVSSEPPALLGGRTIAVTRDSASGRALLECLLRGRHGVRASYERVDDALSCALEGRPTLLIGDAALAARGQVAPEAIHDLGTAWHRWTGLPMVFAVWAVRRDVLEARPDDVAALAAAYASARAWGALHLAAVVDAALERRPAARAFYEQYFRTLSYTLDADAAAGLARFTAEISDVEALHVAR